jgi:hypothetical protein
MPGMTHCAGGEGPNAFDKVGVMEKWVEHKQPPARIVASHSTDGKSDRTRPLCPYSQIAAYKGSGSIDDEANFVCKTPEPCQRAGEGEMSLRDLCDLCVRSQRLRGLFGTNARNRRGLSYMIVCSTSSVAPAALSFGRNTVTVFA